MQGERLKNKIKGLMKSYENEYLYNDIYEIYKVLDEIIEENNPVINVGGVSITINNNPIPEEETNEVKINPMKKKQWSLYVRERGNYTCAKCGKVDEAHCQAHHIFPIARYPELVYDKGNGIVLCQHCHAEYHKEYLGRESPYTLMYFLQMIEEV